jgi:TolA-binding protein
MTSGRKALIAALMASLAITAAPAPAAAQDDARMRRIETELRALQRAVFPGGDGRFFAPEVTTPSGQPQPQPQIGTPSTTALVDILARLDSLEGQLAQLTARTEENDNAMRLLRAEVAAIKSAQAPAFSSAPPTGVVVPPASGSGSMTPTPGPAPIPAATQVATPASTPGSTPASAATPRPAAAPSSERLARVQAVLKPQTADAGDDEYTYGFRLWEAKLYPEAQQQLARFLQAHPRHARVSFGRNLLGRAYLDDGKPREAATHFFENYQANKQGDRAPDSLLYLAEAMAALNDTNRACIALAEFGETYPALATGRLKSQYDTNRARVRCS